MSEHGGSEKPFDLEERTFLFAKEVLAFVKLLPRSISNETSAKTRRSLRRQASRSAVNKDMSDWCRRGGASIPL